MIVYLTEKEAEYLRSAPFCDWKRTAVDVNTMRILREGYVSQSIIKKEKFYYNLYRKLGGKEVVKK